MNTSKILGAREVRLLALSGSLRAGATNTALLEAAALVAPPGVRVDLYRDLAALPAFNPDLDTGDEAALPRIAAQLRARVGEADGILISTPEYAHGIPGSFKNLLDWLVGSLEFPGKPVALIGASSRSVHAKAQLTEVLTTMSARLVAEASVTIEMAGTTLDSRGIAGDEDRAKVLRGVVEAMVREIRVR